MNRERETDSILPGAEEFSTGGGSKDVTRGTGLSQELLDGLRGLRPQVEEISALIEKKIREIEADPQPEPGSNEKARLLRKAVSSLRDLFSDKILNSHGSIKTLNKLVHLVFIDHFQSDVEWRLSSYDNKDLWNKIKALRDEYVRIVPGGGAIMLPPHLTNPEDYALGEAQE